MAHENFTKKVGEESPEFAALMNILAPFNNHAAEGRKFLNLVNHIIDFYLSRDVVDENVKMPIIFFPLCEEWAQRLCEEFVSLKAALFLGEGTRACLLKSYRDRPYLQLPEKANKRVRDALSQQLKFKRKISENLPTSVPYHASSDTTDKTFIYSKAISEEYYLTANTPGHYHFCSDIMSHTFSTNKSLIILGENETDAYKAIELNDGSVKVRNIFLFPQKEMDGRYARICMQMQRSTINEYNEDYDTGVLNVFSFIFSQKPYRLHKIYECKSTLVERIQRERISQTHDFISFTKDEMNYIFEREEDSITYHDLVYHASPEISEIKTAFDYIIHDIQNEIRLRNELAICLTDRSKLRIKEKILAQNPDANDKYLEYFLSLMDKNNKHFLYNELSKWVNFHSVGVVVDYNVEPFYKEQLKEFLISDLGATSIKFYTFKSFKAHKTKSSYINEIKENRVLVFSMLNHCTGHNWAIYPNSFDNYYLNPGQSILQINNRLVFDPYFSWYKYRYAEQLKLLLNSDFRVKYMQNGIVLPKKPTDIGPEPDEDRDEFDLRNRQVDREQNRVTITFIDGNHRTLNEDDLVLCKQGDSIIISSISELLRDFDDPTALEIQPLIDFNRPLEIFIDNEERKIGDGETLIRNNPQYGLTEEEIASDCEMWKILLRHRVTEYGEGEVYNEIMRPLLPIEQIRLVSFRRWLDLSDTSILPRSRVMQKRVLEEYLQIEALYTRILRHRKSRISTTTEDRNSIFKAFLTRCLVEEDAEKAYNNLSYEICDFLNIANKHDMIAITDLIKDETLNLRQINSINYD